MSNIAESALAKTGFFHSRPFCSRRRKSSKVLHGIRINSGTAQSGILRSNCIDSLDRTNAAQFVMGKVALGHQVFFFHGVRDSCLTFKLHAMGMTASPQLHLDDEVVEILLDMFQEMGNLIALQ